jgi:hypothetical protein
MRFLLTLATALLTFSYGGFSYGGTVLADPPLPENPRLYPYITLEVPTVPASSSLTRSPAPPPRLEQAERLDLPLTWIPGDCESVGAVFFDRGATEEEVNFFVGRGILKRETGCGLKTVNPNTSDRGICQINGVHRRPGYFWGKRYGDGGWTAQLGVYHWTDPDSPVWVDACLYLYRREGTSPWSATL